MSSEGLHESPELLTPETLELHRAIVSLIEELEAVDWYQQRAEACTDAGLQAVLLHHHDEELEHAAMNLEWLRRHSVHFDAMLRTYLFTDRPITEIEAGVNADDPSCGGGGADRRPPEGSGHPPALGDDSLGIGELAARAEETT